MFIPKGRAFILILLFLSCAALVHGLDHEGSTDITNSLDQFPDRIGQWRILGTQQTMEDQIEEILGVDDYLLANFQGPEGRVINVYISYFARTGRNKGYHSPLNCMPGSGWEIADTKSMSLDQPGTKNSANVNLLLLQKGNDRQIGLYWYQCRGRIMANEYMERAYRVMDSIVRNRTDGALIRLMATESEGEIEQDRKMLKNFAENLIPVLWDYLPE